MTTKVAGGVMGYRLALTLEANYNAAMNDCVMGGPGDFQVSLCDGSKPILGQVIMPNVKRGSGALAGTYPQPSTPGDVSIGTRGHAVQTFTSAAAITVGAAVNVNATGGLVPSGTANSQPIGIALNGAAGSGTKIDVLVQ
jgi:hypothetical protein